MLDFIKEMIERDAITFTYRGKELLFKNNDEANLYTLELAKKFIVKTNDKPDKDIPIEALALYKYEPSEVLQMIKDNNYPEDLKLVTTAPEATEKDNKIIVTTEVNKNNEPDKHEINKFEVKVIHGFPKVETRSLPEESNTTIEVMEEPEFKFIQGFPVALNNEHGQIQANELKTNTKQPEAVKNDSKYYLSDEFEEKDFQSWTNDKHILIVANAGAGKTTLMLDKFTSWAEKQEPMKRVLYLHNRNVMKAQFADRKAEEHKNLEICSYQGIEERTKDIKIDVQNYIDSFDYILSDECHYFVSDAAFNKKTFLSYEAVNNCKGTAIYFTATPKFFLRMTDKLNKPLKIIDKTDLSKKNIQKIYLAKNLDIFNKFEAKLLEKQKIIHFENDNDKLKLKESKYSKEGYKAAMVLSEYSEDKNYMNDEVAEQIKHSTDEKGNDIANVFTDWLGCTSAYENGVNFNIEGSVTVSFAKYINWTSLEQSLSRVRNFKDNNVNMLICLPHKNFFRNIDFVEPEVIDYLEYCNEKTDKNAVFGRDEYYKYNDFVIAYHKIGLDEVQEILNADDKIKYYKEKLHELYPNAEIVVIDSNDLIDIDSTIEKFMEGNEEINLIYPEEKEKFVNTINELLKDKEHTGRKLKLNKISKKMKELNSSYCLTKYPKAVKIKNNEGKETTTTKWILKKVT